MELRSHYIHYLEKVHTGLQPDIFADFCETELTAFIRQHVMHDFSSIYEETHRLFYDDIRQAIPVSVSMREANKQSGDRISQALRFYSAFLQSKYFPQPKPTKAKKEKVDTPTKVQETPKPIVEREETEGERQHVEFERLHRNPALRQRCLDKWGYRCQVCGIDMAVQYGEELGGRFIEVHHLKPISTYDESRPDDYVENLVPLCPNCHAMIHHGQNGPLSLSELRQAYRGPKYELEKWKED